MFASPTSCAVYAFCVSPLSTNLISVFTCVVFSCECPQLHPYFTSPTRFTSALSWDKVFQEFPWNRFQAFSIEKIFFYHMLRAHFNNPICLTVYLLKCSICEVGSGNVNWGTPRKNLLSFGIIFHIAGSAIENVSDFILFSTRENDLPAWQDQKEVAMSDSDCRNAMFSPACSKRDTAGSVPTDEGLQLTNTAHIQGNNYV